MFQDVDFEALREKYDPKDPGRSILEALIMIGQNLNHRASVSMAPTPSDGDGRPTIHFEGGFTTQELAHLMGR